MRQYAVLKNVVRDVNFGVVVKSAGNLKFFGWSEKAVEWANWANSNNADLSQLPPNISVGEFKGMSDETMKSIILNSQDAVAAGSATIGTKTLAFDLGREHNPNASKFPSFIDSPISGDWVSKHKSINFKAQNFRKEVVQNELALRVRMHELAFNNETKQFVSKPNKITATHTRSEIQKKMSRGAERKFGKQIVEYTNKEILKNHVAPTIKRDALGNSTKEILDTFVKARLGRAIGRAAGNAIRGATPNRRTRGVASRFISGVLDPRKRRDIDGDGLIFDGTWREMPDPNRFIQDPKKPSIDAIRRNRDTIQEAFRRAQGRPAERDDGLRSSGRLRGDLNLPGGGGVGIRSIDPEENRRAEDRLRAEDEMRRQFSDEMSKIINELRDAGLTTEKPKRGKRERRLSDGTSLRSSGATANEPPRAATAVQMAFDTRNSRKASKMTYDPQTNSVEVTYNDGRTRRFDNVPYQEARRAGADDAIDRLITDMETGRIGKESKEPMMGLRSSGGRREPEKPRTYGMDPFINDEFRRSRKPLEDAVEEIRRASKEPIMGFRSSGKYTRGNMSRLTPQSQSRVDNAKEMLDSGRVDNVRQLMTQIEGLDLRISRNQNYLDSLRDTLRRLGPSDKRRPDTEKDFERAEQELGVDMAIRDLTQQRLKRIDRGPKPGGLRSGGAWNAAERLPGEDSDLGRYDDMPSVEDAVKKLTSGDRMSADELEYLDEVTDRILNDPDTPENIRDSMLDLKNSISARRKTGGNTLRSSGGGGVQRGRMSVDAELKKFLKDWEKTQSQLSEEDDRGSFGAALDAALRSPIRDIPGIKKDPNARGGWDLSDVDFESLTDDQLISLLSLFPQLGPSPLRPGVNAQFDLNDYLNPNSNKKNSVNAIAKELRKRGYKVELGKAREPKYYGDYSAGDRYWVARKTNATLSARAKKGQTTRARRKRWEGGTLSDEGAAQLRSARPDGLTPLRSSSRQRVDTPLSTRRSMATTERAAKPRGTTLRSSGGGKDTEATPRTPVRKATPGRGVGAGPGGKAGHARMERVYGRDKKGGDGKVFDSLTPEQQDAVKKALAEEVKPALDKKLKGFFSKYWKARTERGSKKQSLVAVRRRAKGDARGRYGKVAEDTPLESADIYEMLYRLDGQVAEGLLEKFEVSDKDSRELKLTEDGEAKVSTAKNGYTVQQRALDDAQTIMNMIEDGDFSALEHLHPATKKKIADVIKKNGGEVPKGWIDSESSVAGWAGGEGRTKAPDAIDLEKERGIGKKKKEKRLSLFQRLRRVDPERERRVELRAARRQGQIREGIELDPDLELKRRILRGRAMKRTFMSRFRKNRDPETLATDMSERRQEVAILKTNPADGKVEVTDGYIDLLHALDQGLIGINEKKRKGASEAEVESEHKALLRRLWENSGYSETPIQLKEDEIKLLLDAGWQPIMRGTGHEKVNSETYVEQFITSEGRFIPGQGGSAFGIGEYFSYPGEWGSYHGANPTDRHTLVALLPPTSTIIKKSEIEREHANLGAITTKISDAFKIIGGRDATKAMEPEELVAEIDKAVPDLSSDTSRTGQIVKQLRVRLEALSKLPKTNDEERGSVQAQKEKILNSLDYLQRFSKQRSAEMIAPLIGVDAIDVNEDDSSIEKPILLHNRTNVAVLQVPTTYEQGLAIVAGPNGERRPKAWLKWKQKSVQTPDREAPRRRSPRRARRAQPPAPQPATPNPPTPTPSAPAPSTPSPDGKGAKAPVDVSSWTSSRPQSTGSNPATLLTAPDGTQYYAKLPKGTPDDKDRMETEALASELYKLAGIQSADVQMGTRNGQPVTLSRMVQSRMPNSQGDQDEALKGYVADAWLANWDAPLNDNIKIDSNGNAIRLDVGGSLDFRAQGARKGQAWGNTVGEIDSMKKNGTYDYTKITDAAIKQQAKALGNVTDADIRATVSRIVSDPARAKALADTLIARRDDIVKRYA